MKFAVKIRYLTSKYTSDGKWHQHTTKWYSDSSEAWREADLFQFNNSRIISECSCGLMHKEG